MSAPVVLVHGAWGGAWAWGLVKAELERRGIEAIAVDLPSREEAPSALADDVAVVRGVLSGLSEPAVLVGHSYSGVVVTDASAGNDRVRYLVYVCAVMPQEGETTSGVMATDPHPSMLGEAIVSHPDGRYVLTAEGARKVLFNDVDDATAAPVIEALGTHRGSVFGEPATALGWKEHPSTYIVTTDDLVFSPDLQRRMAASASEVVEIDAGHIPLLSRPAEVADVIARAAG